MQVVEAPTRVLTAPFLGSLETAQVWCGARKKSYQSSVDIQERQAEVADTAFPQAGSAVPVQIVRRARLFYAVRTSTLAGTNHGRGGMMRRGPAVRQEQKTNIWRHAVTRPGMRAMGLQESFLIEAIRRILKHPVVSHHPRPSPDVHN
jgi:hypothetical protein